MPRFDEYTYETNLPFLLKRDIVRTPVFYTKLANWHDDIELEYIKEGEGLLFLDGEKIFFHQGDFIFIPSNSIHHLIPSNNVKYSCLLINKNFCQNLDFSQNITKQFNNKELTTLFLELEVFESTPDAPFIKIKKYNNLLKQLVILNEQHYSTENNKINTSTAQQKIQEVIIYIRNHFSEKITLDKISKNVAMSKFDLSRKFKETTNLTIIEFVNYYRCKIAASKIQNGISVSEAALYCGFENMSYFTKTFKKHFHCLPSQQKRLKQ